MTPKLGINIKDKEYAAIRPVVTNKHHPIKLQNTLTKNNTSY